MTDNEDNVPDEEILDSPDKFNKRLKRDLTRGWRKALHRVKGAQKALEAQERNCKRWCWLATFGSVPDPNEEPAAHKLFGIYLDTEYRAFFEQRTPRGPNFSREQWDDLVQKGLVTERVTFYYDTHDLWGGSREAFDELTDDQKVDLFYRSDLGELYGDYDPDSAGITSVFELTIPDWKDPPE